MGGGEGGDGPTFGGQVLPSRSPAQSAAESAPPAPADPHRRRRRAEDAAAGGALRGRLFAAPRAADSGEAGDLAPVLRGRGPRLRRHREDLRFPLRRRRRRRQGGRADRAAPLAGRHGRPDRDRRNPQCGADSPDRAGWSDSDPSDCRPVITPSVTKPLCGWCEKGGTGMSTYNVVLFLHVCGPIGYFVAMCSWLFCLASLRRAHRVEQVRVLSNLVGRLGPLFGISVLLILVTGLYMASTTWGFQTGWIDVALVSLILIAPLGTAAIEPRRRAIARLAQEAPDGPLPAALDRRTHDPVAAAAGQTVTALRPGGVFFVTNTHPAWGSRL